MTSRDAVMSASRGDIRRRGAQQIRAFDDARDGTDDANQIPSSKLLRALEDSSAKSSRDDETARRQGRRDDDILMWPKAPAKRATQRQRSLALAGGLRLRPARGCRSCLRDHAQAEVQQQRCATSCKSPSGELPDCFYILAATRQVQRACLFKPSPNRTNKIEPKASHIT
jgi:hypothetical protein